MLRQLLVTLVVAAVLTLLEAHPLVHSRSKRQDIYFDTRHDETHNLPVMPFGYDQTAASNTGTQSIYGPDGSQTHQTFGGSQSSNLAKDMSSGQLSAANTQQQTVQSGDKFESQNSGASQSANFAKEHQLLSNANTNTNVIKDKDSIREQTSGGAASSVQNQLGNSASQAQTNNESYKGKDGEGSRTSGSSSSQNIGNDGSGSTSNANTNAETIVLPDGTIIRKSSGSSFSFQSSGQTNVFSMANSNSGSG